VREIARKGPLLAREAKDAGLIDRLGYRDDFQAAVKAAFPGKGLATEAYAATVESPDTAVKIALVQASGQIVAGEAEDGPMSDHTDIGALDIARDIRDAAQTKGVRAIVLRLNSPGGDYAASDTIRQAVAAARRGGVPVIVSMGDVAASGGYFIASAAETIIAEDATITGSIGVIAGKIVLEDAWAKLGVRWNSLKTGDTAAMGSPNRGFSPTERTRLEAVVDSAYSDFTAKVGEARKLSAEAVDKVARGRVFSGRQAKRLGLVDDTGGLIKAFAYAKRAAGIPADQIPAVVSFPRQKSLSESLRDLLGGEAENPLAQIIAPLPEPLSTLRGWNRLDLMHGAAILPPITVQ
jgi:protease-4